MSSAPLPPPPAAPHWEPHVASNGTSAQPLAQHWEQRAFSNAHQPNMMRPVPASHQSAAPLVQPARTWEEGVEDGTDFFADTPSRPGAEQLSEPVPFAAAHGTESVADADTVGPQPVYPEQNPTELAPASSAGVGSAGSNHTTPFGAPGSQAQPFEWDAGQQAQPEQWSDQSQVWAASQGHSQWDQSSGARPAWDPHAGAHWDHSQQSGVLPAGPAVEYGRQQWEPQAPAQAAQWGSQQAGDGQQWGGSDLAYGSQTAVWGAAHPSTQVCLASEQIWHLGRDVGACRAQLWECLVTARSSRSRARACCILAHKERGNAVTTVCYACRPMSMRCRGRQSRPCAAPAGGHLCLCLPLASAVGWWPCSLGPHPRWAAHKRQCWLWDLCS